MAKSKRCRRSYNACTERMKTLRWIWNVLNSSKGLNPNILAGMRKKMLTRIEKVVSIE